MLDDGTVFFESGNALVPADSNGKVDVYASNGADIGLVSSGHSDGDSTFADATPDGDSVFFFTSEPLVSQDVDRATDVYVAKVGGGLPDQNAVVVPTRCQGDGCQGQLLPPVEFSPIGTVDFLGDGNAIGGEGTPPRVPRVSAAVKKIVRGATFTVSVKTPAGGRITVSGARINTVRKRVSKSGLHRVSARLTASATRVLVRKRSLRVTVRVGYTPARGSSSSVLIPITFRSR
jgi:hypothetical protein